MELPQNYERISRYKRKLVRDEYIRIQDGNCWFCKGKLNESSLYDHVSTVEFVKGFYNHPIHLHHDHGTGMTIGAVHAKCNGVSYCYLEKQHDFLPDYDNTVIMLKNNHPM